MDNESRFDKLFKYLEPGTSDLVKQKAAQQFGNIQSLFPDQFPILISKLKPYLYHDSWETRVGSALCLESICKSLKDNPFTYKLKPDEEDEKITKLLKNFISHFNLSDFVKICPVLLSGVVINDVSSADVSAKKRKHKSAEKTVDQLVFNDKLNVDISCESSSNPSTIQNQNTVETTSKHLQTLEEYCNNFKQHSDFIDSTANNLPLNTLNELCDSFLVTLFHENWPIRHGSALALRSIMMNCTDIIYINTDYSHEQNIFLNRFHLLKICLYSLCLISVDHFYDFTMDHAVAPVVETCSHVITTIIYNFNSYAVDVTNILIELMSYDAWKYKFSSLITLRYFFGICNTNRDIILKKVYPNVKECLELCKEENVISASCHFLCTNIEYIFNLFPNEFSSLFRILTGLVAKVDDTDTTICEVVTLLASVVARLNKKEINQKFDSEFPIQKFYLNLWRLCLQPSIEIIISTLNALTFLVPCTGIEWKFIDEYDSLKFYVLILFYIAMTEPCSKVSKSCLRALSSLIQTISHQALEILFDWWFLNHFFSIAHPSKLVIYLKPPSSAFINEIPSKPQCLGKCVEGDDDSTNYRKELTCRITCAKMMAQLLVKFLEETNSNYIDQIFKITPLFNVNDPIVKHVTCLILIEISKLKDKKHISTPELIQKLNDGIIGCQPKIVQNPQNLVEKEELFAAINLSELFLKLKLKKPDDSKTSDASASITYSNIKNELKSINIVELIQAVKEKSELYFQFQRSLTQYRQIHLKKYTRTSFLYSYVLILLENVPDKITPIVSTLMDCICDESTNKIKSYSYKALVKLVDLCLNRTNPPTDRILTFLSNKCISSHKFLQGYYKMLPMTLRLDDNQTITIDHKDGIFSLIKHFSIINESVTNKNDDETNNRMDCADIIDNILSLKTSFKGCSKALNTLIKYFNEKTEDCLSLLLNSSIYAITKHQSGDNSSFSNDDHFNHLNHLNHLMPNSNSKLIDSIILTSVIVKKLYKINPQLIQTCLPAVCKLISSPDTLLRHASSNCFTIILSLLSLKELIHVLYESIFPTMDHSTVVNARQGCLEVIFIILNANGKKNYLYDQLFNISLHLIIPVLKRMNDSCLQIRYLSSHCLSQIMYYIPINFCEKDYIDDFGGEESSKKKDLSLISQLLNPSTIDIIDIPFEITAKFRTYQREGISWLGFLNKFNLNGALCDDMGLGKTIQALAIISYDHFMNPNRESPSLIIAPKILIQHWYDEAMKFIPESVLKLKLLNLNPKSDSNIIPMELNKMLMIASYDHVRRKSEFFTNYNWNYIVLDEAHIIKNHKSKIFNTILKLNGLHKLVLTGTPIQNCVMELWSLFDFLMPGFLGTHSQFMARYVKPIVKSREGKCSTEDFEAGSRALDSLHKRVLPFILRRLKNDVLKDLPEKIIQDYYCELSELQAKLYDSCTNKSMVDSFMENVNETNLVSQNSKFNHIFKSLHYLRKVCNHPALVIPNTDVNLIKSIGGYDALHSLKNNPKLEALRQLLISCGFNEQSNSSDEALQPLTTNQHRVIIFSQFTKTMLLIEEDLLKRYLPSINYLKLDSSIKESVRYDVVKRFNEDLSVDLILATTSIGGLGLNLTSADTVIFYDHDWNPMKDLQAMDRAHRIGQTKVVNVYRIITKNTIEEKIMNLQAFKVKVAESVVSHENSVTDIKTNKVLQVMDYGDIGYKHESNESSNDKNFVQPTSSDIHDPNEEYKLEFDVDNFINLLKRK